MENKNMMDTELENVTGGAAYYNNYYTVKNGDTLSAIAVKFGLRTIRLNNSYRSITPSLKHTVATDYFALGINHY